MNKIKSLTLSILISFFLLGLLNLLTLQINKKIFNDHQSKMEVLFKYDLKVQKLYGLIVKPMEKVEAFYIYNYFDGVFKKYNFKNDDNAEKLDKETAMMVSLYKTALLPICAILTFAISFAMITNAIRFGQILAPFKQEN